MQKRIALLALFALVAATGCSAQGDKSKRPSPAASASCDLGGGKTLKTDYSSPRMKGRKIYGDLVPFGQVWRTGANESTTFVTSCRHRCRRNECSRRQLHDLHRPQRRQVELSHQQGDGRMGHSIPWPGQGSRTRRHESFEASVAG